MRYCLLSFSARMATLLISDHVGEASLRSMKVEEPEHQQNGYHEQGGDDALPVGAGSEQRPSNTPDDGSHGIEFIDCAPAVRNKSRRIRDRRNEQPELSKERNGIAHVPVAHVQCGERQSASQRHKGGEQEQGDHGENSERGNYAVEEHQCKKDKKRSNKIRQAAQDR